MEHGFKDTTQGAPFFHLAKVIDAAGWVPQHRERVFVVGSSRAVSGNQPGFEYPEPPYGPAPKYRGILDPDTLDNSILSGHL